MSIEVVAIHIKETESKQNPNQSNPKTLALSEIYVSASVFQPRQFSEGSEAHSEDHIIKLLDAIKSEPSHTLDPIVVWWAGKSWVVLDGHHRILAYSRYKLINKSKEISIPIKVFLGSIYEAIAESTRLNSKDKLSMSKADKMNRAWKCTALEKYSKKGIQNVCKVSGSTIARMRVYLNELKAKHPDNYREIAMEQTWEEILKSKFTMQDYDDGWKSKLASDWSNRLGKTFGSKFATQPEIAALAIEIYSNRLPTELIKNWQEYIEEFKTEIEESDF